MKVGIDPPAGWAHGFPKIYDTENDPPMHVWLREQGYPNPDYSIAIRSWPVDGEEFTDGS